MTDRLISFDPLFNPFLTIAVGLILFFVFAFFEWKRQLKYRIVRVISIAAVVLSILGLILRPETKHLNNSSAILLTQGFDKAKVDQLLKTNPKNKLVTAPGVEQYKNSTSLNSWNELDRLEVSQIIGEGLPGSARELINPGTLNYTTAKYPIGIIQLNIPSNVIEKRRSKITGILNTSIPETTLYLEGAGGIEDSTIINGTGKNNFSLSFTPKKPGNVIYKIKDKKTVNESLPIQVSSEPSSRILFLQKYPTFETQYLKNYLGQHNSLLFRYQLSRSTFRYEYVNHKSIKIDRLTETVLSDFDLLVIDSDALTSLTTGERNALTKAINEGLGMLTLFNENPSGIKSLKTFFDTKFLSVQSADTALFEINSKKITLPTWPVNASNASGLSAVTQTKKRLLSGYEFHGFGKSGFQFLQETYQLALRGDSSIYHTLWSELIGKVSRTTQLPTKIQFTTPFPVYPNEPVSFKIISNQTPTAFYKNTQIPLKEELLIDDVWTGKLWTDQIGWDTLKIEGDSTEFYFFVADKNEWSSLASANNIQETQRIASSSLSKNDREETSYRKLPPWIFYLMFLISAGFLWIVPKL